MLPLKTCSFSLLAGSHFCADWQQSRFVKQRSEHLRHMHRKFTDKRATDYSRESAENVESFRFMKIKLAMIAFALLATLGLDACSSGPNATAGTATGAVGGTVVGGPVGGAAGAVAGNVAGRRQDRAMGY